MILRFIKTSHREYTLRCEVLDTVVLERTLEAKSFLRHDLMHYVVERVAGLKNSFYGRLHQSDQEAMADETEIMNTEMVVAILQ